MSDLELDYDSDQEVSENHSKLTDAVRQLDKGQRVRKPERSEPSLEVSEFHLVKSGISDKDAVTVEDLAKTLGKKGHHSELNKKINSARLKSKVLPKPLEKPAAEKIKRTVGFENTKKELGKWTGIIARNRTAACVNFPISQSSMKLVPSEEYVKKFRIQSELEKKLAELEPEEEPEEVKDEFPLTLEEILERRKEAAKFRAQQSYKEAKAHRQNKIKSKKYHRIQRRERIKKTMKEFEELQKTDPQAALQKLEELDKTRAEERMTLRHKSTGQWAKSKQVRAKYDKESRQVLAEQLAISRELTQKVKKDDDSNDEDCDQDLSMQVLSSDKENPWMNAVKTGSEVEEFIKGYRKYWDERNRVNQATPAEDASKSSENVNEVEKVFEVPVFEACDASKNPVVSVIEEDPINDNFSETSGENEVFVSKKSGSDVCSSTQIQRLEKSSKNKLGIKQPKSKNTKKAMKRKSGTSSWSVSPVDVISDNTSLENITSEIPLQQQKEEKKSKNNKRNREDIDIDEMFDSLDSKLQEKIKKKLTNVESELANEKKRKRKMTTNEECDSANDVAKLGLKGQQTIKPVIDKPLEESSRSHPSNENVETTKLSSLTDLNYNGTSKSKTTEIDPNKFLSMKPKHIKTLLPDEAGGEGDILDDSEADEEQNQMISEAFADDDVVDEFRKEKEEEIKKSQPEDVDLRLPGWGSWGGKDIKQSARKKRRFILKFPKEAPRRDENKGDVVIIEEKCPKIKRHLVNELPFPFTSVQDFEASIRAPIGREFVPEKTFSKLIQPSVKTKMGKVIEPMSEDMLIKMKGLKEKEKKLNDKGQKKNDQLIDSLKKRKSQSAVGSRKKKSLKLN
ncbi:hypothetical protein QAD02_004101 [Eretmocerus hayati]|uniref:Uncharacterized protein n=1 Tax=Eretmocerus hayati TaxID=131215 RepID=A0ACC2NPN3_9HYME|nr:hypothetical protein QAD02_004101 [Eretmocerus hayati]